MFDNYLWFIVSVVLTLVMHEAGHIFMLTKYTKKPVTLKFSKDIIVGKESDYKNLSDQQYISVLLVGIFVGTIPIIWYSDLIKNDYFSTVYFILYLIGCNSDIRNILLTITKLIKMRFLNW